MSTPSQRDARAARAAQIEREIRATHPGVGALSVAEIAAEVRKRTPLGGSPAVVARWLRERRRIRMPDGSPVPHAMDKAIWIVPVEAVAHSIAGIEMGLGWWVGDTVRVRGRALIVLDYTADDDVSAVDPTPWLDALRVECVRLDAVALAEAERRVLAHAVGIDPDGIVEREPGIL